MSIHKGYDGYEVFARRIIILPGSRVVRIGECSPKRGPESAAIHRLVSAKFDLT
jgi:hypothetical protein